MQKYIPLGISVLWIIVQLTMLGLFGIGHGGDTERYLRSGRDLVQGQLPTGKAASYMSYNLTVAASFAAGLGKPGVVAIQLAASAIAAWCMHGLGRTLWNRTTGLMAAFLYVAFLKLHPWNAYILTDSLFISFIIITTYLFSQALATKKRGYIAATAAAALYTTFLRPDGLAVPLAFGLVALISLFKHRAWKTLALLAAAVLAITPTAWQFAGRLASHEFLIEHYAKGAVIWSYEPYYLAMPGQLPDTITPETHPLLGLMHFILDKPLYILRLAGAKMLLFLLHIRPYHAFFHNFLIVMWLAILYPAAYLTLKHHPGRFFALTLFVLTLFTLKALIAGATFADWSGRFFLHVAPILLLFAAPSLTNLLIPIQKHIHSTKLVHLLPQSLRLSR